MANNRITEPDLEQVLDGLPLNSINSIAEFFDVSPVNAARMIGIPRATYFRIKEEDRKLSVQYSDRIASILKIILVAKENFESEDDVTRLWFLMPHPTLDNKKPIDCLETEIGRRLVERALLGKLQPSVASHRASHSEELEEPPRRLKVFLCHGSEDKGLIRKLYESLMEVGMDPWLDEKNLTPGIEWEPTIRAAVRNSDVVLVCLSKQSASKTGFAQKEIVIALDAAEERPEGAVFIIPVLLEECQLPSRLAKWQSVRLYETEGYAKLVWGLQKIMND